MVNYLDYYFNHGSKNNKLILTQTGNRIVDIWECSENFCQLITDLQRGKTYVSDKDKLNRILKMIRIIKMNKIIKKVKMIKIIRIIKTIKPIK